MLPGFEVVNLTLVGGIITALPRAYRVDRSRHEPLLVVGYARGPVEVDRPLMGMDERDIAVVAQCPRDKLRSGDSSAIGELEGDFLAAAVDYSVEFIKGENHLRRHRRPRRIRLAKEEVFGRFQGLIGIQCSVHIRHIGRIPGNGQ